MATRHVHRQLLPESELYYLCQNPVRYFTEAPRQAVDRKKLDSLLSKDRSTGKWVWLNELK